jgi:hypothetical protein
MGWPVHRLGRLLRLERACLDGPRRPKRNHNRHLHHRPAIAVPHTLGNSLNCPGAPEMKNALRIAHLRKRLAPWRYRLEPRRAWEDVREGAGSSGDVNRSPQGFFRRSVEPSAAEALKGGN